MKVKAKRKLPTAKVDPGLEQKLCKCEQQLHKKPNLNISISFLQLETALGKKLMNLDYGSKVSFIYNPLDYAAELHSDYIKKYCQGEKDVLLIGMNPGPWGMCQTGVPFGEVNHVKNWLKIEGEIKQPDKVHEQRPIEGLSCQRKEVSGERMWNLLQELSEEPDILFRHVFVHNYCPLAFLAKSGKNVTPPELKAKERQPLEELCDNLLIETVQLLQAKHLVCIGNYVLQKTEKALAKSTLTDIQVSLLMHPSPVNPSANKGWKEIAIRQLKEAKVLPYFNCSKMNSDEFMQAAFEQAEEALSKGEVPVGCVFVHHGNIIARGRNTVNETKNATRHAEINALDSVFAWSRECDTSHCVVLKDCTLYVTVEPCIMCAEALGRLKLGKLVFGCSNDRFGGCGSVLDLTSSFESLSIVKGFHADKAIHLLREFYKGENPNAPTENVKRKTRQVSSFTAS